MTAMVERVLLGLAWILLAYNLGIGAVCVALASPLLVSWLW